MQVASLNCGDFYQHHYVKLYSTFMIQLQVTIPAPTRRPTPPFPLPPHLPQTRLRNRCQNLGKRGSGVWILHFRLRLIWCEWHPNARWRTLIGLVPLTRVRIPPPTGHLTPHTEHPRGVPQRIRRRRGTAHPNLFFFTSFLLFLLLRRQQRTNITK